MSERKPYPSDVSDDEWAFVAPYLTLMTEDAPQREHSLREVMKAPRSKLRGINQTTGAAAHAVVDSLFPDLAAAHSGESCLRSRVDPLC